MNGVSLTNLITSVNGGSPIDDTLVAVLVGIAKGIFEGERDWMVLRNTNTSISFSSGSTWQTPYVLTGITDFSRFYGDFPVKVFDGNNRTEYYRQVPWNQRLAYKDVSNTFVYNEATKTMYFNGVNSMSGTVYLDYIMNPGEIDMESDTGDFESAGTFPFPKRVHPILAFYVVGVSKGAIDYDEINRAMLPTNQATLVAIKTMAEKWDTKKQLSEVENTDPYRRPDGVGFTPNKINIDS